jgi:hypothetical protein
MVNYKIFIAVFVVLVLVIVGIFVLTNNKNPSDGNINSQENANQMVDCGKAKDPGCFLNRMGECLPVTAKMTGTDGSTAIDITVLGVENETCHFQRKINNVVDLDCHFQKGTFNGNILDQIFGNDRGLQKVIDDACSKPGW